MRIVIVGLIAACLFLFPFVLWPHGTIPIYATAEIFSLLLTTSALYAGYRYLSLHFIDALSKTGN